MKFSPVVPFALSTLITTCLAAPTTLRQPGPVSVGRRSSDAAPVEGLASVQEKRQAGNFNLGDYHMGVGEDLELVKKEKRSEQEKRQAGDFNLGDYNMGVGEDLELVKKEKRQAGDFNLGDYNMGVGEDLELVKKEKRQAGDFNLGDYNMGVGEDLELVKKALRADPLIRRKAAELRALIKERSAAPASNDIEARTETRMPDVAAPAA